MRTVLLITGAVVGYILLLATHPTRASFRDGWRCVVRYRRLYSIPFVFAACHAAFGLWVHYDEARNLPGAPPFLIPWLGWHPPVWGRVFPDALLPAAESVASIFNCAVTTFPLSALWGLLFLLNWRGYQGELARGLRRHFGGWIGTAVHLIILACSLAACAKPILFGKMAWLSASLDERTLLEVGEGINWLSFIFEYAIGVGVQVYLLLLAFTWVRGLNFDLEALRRFALRRWVLVSQWAGALLLLSSLGINLPLLLTHAALWPELSADRATTIVNATRWTLAGVLTLFCTVQISLVFHNETLWRAFGAHGRFVRRYGWHVGWFVLLVAVHYLLLAAANGILPAALGDWTWPAVGWKTIGYPLLWAVLSGWSLAAWVCLFRRCEAGNPETDDLVRF